MSYAWADRAWDGVTVTPSASSYGLFDAPAPPAEASSMPVRAESDAPLKLRTGGEVRVDVHDYRLLMLQYCATMQVAAQRRICRVEQSLSSVLMENGWCGAGGG